jgi:hypothetical protein
MIALNKTRTEATERSLMDDNTGELLLSACCRQIANICVGTAALIAVVVSEAGRRYHGGRAGGRLGLGEVGPWDLLRGHSTGICTLFSGFTKSKP